MTPTWLSERGVTLMAVVNVNPDSFSDPRGGVDIGERIEAALAAAEAGADVVDLGAQSAALAAREVPADEQTSLLVPVVRALDDAGVPVSVDTYDAEVARTVLAAGADILNDFSGALDPAVLAAVAADSAWYVLTHNPVGPRGRQTAADYYDDVIADVLRVAEDGLTVLAEAGVPPDRVLLDPGVDVGKTPKQTLDLLRRLPELRASTPLPQLLAISRKDVLGVLTGRLPAARDAASLALLGHVASQPRTLVRLHDVAAAVDYLAVRDALDGLSDIHPDRLLSDALRRQDA